ncbi:hypothetical protein [Lutibaculum baratangense]|uniref:Uncharacterized protein n=1 Tax=Lutibaculum baratangense AMV1 TaxID=631454 RepID=V4RWL0_9HYPH|nr:hypothetical protein [Lutibaculum baratangense]ESR27380.1 hypothetical protein N177_0134 [Lutibaculum baratangense AMV1]
MQSARSRRSPGAFLVPAMMAAFGLVYAYANRNVPGSEMRLVTPASIVLLLACAALMVRTWTSGAERREPFTLARLRRPTGLAALFLILLFGADYDFPLAGMAFLAAAMLWLGVRRPLVIVPVAVVSPVLLHLAFSSLGVPLVSFWLKL